MINNLRNKYLADICILLVNDPESCGQNCIIVGNSWLYAGSSYAYAVVVDDYAGSSNWTLAHEIGHIQGAHHDYNTHTNPYFSYGHGFISISGDIRTVMAYNNSNCPDGSCEKISYFSNPSKTNKGIVIGTAQREDNSRVLNETANYVAGFRNATLAGTLQHDEYWIDSYSLQGNVTVPTGKTLTLSSSAIVNLNGYYLKSTGGTIVKETNATVNGVDAFVKSGGSVKGYFSTVQSAIDNSLSTQTVELLSKTYSDNLSFSGKSNISLQGQGTGNTIINGALSITNSSYILINEITLSNTLTINASSHSTIYGCSLNSSTILNDYSGTQTNFGFSSGTYPTANFGYNSYGGTGDIYSTEITDHDVAIYLTNNASYNVGDQNYFCNNLVDIYAERGTKVFATSNTYSYPNSWQGYDENILITGTNYYCGLAKYNAAVSEELFKNDLNNKYLNLIRLISEAKQSGNFELNNFTQDYYELISGYKNTLINNKDIDTLKKSLLNLFHLYKSLNQNEEFYRFILALLNNEVNEYRKPFIERYLIWNFIERNEFNKAIELANKIQLQVSNGDLISEIMYEKAFIHKYIINDINTANELYQELINRYPEHLLSKYALNEINSDGNNNNYSNLNKIVEGYELTSYPNPFNPSTKIQYSIPKLGLVSIKVYDILGKEITQLVNEVKQPGRYEVEFDGSSLSSGIYFYQIQSENYLMTKKMILMK
ncbi:MAG: T9SS type A sorting domain-containing protein [Syntrophothermus sp.]